MPAFTFDNRPKLPGAYVNWVAQVAPTVPPAVGSIVAIPLTHDWGPFKVATLCQSMADFTAIYGDSQYTPGYMAVKQAFLGESVNGRGGAGAVLVYRTGAAAAAKATKVLQNTTPATALTLTAKYEGTKGNNLRITTQDYAGDSTQNQLLIYGGTGGTTLLETYTYLDTDITGLAAQINAQSHWVTAVANLSGVALAAVTASAFAGGNDGATLVTGDWTAIMTALESQRFGILAPYDLTDNTIMASLVAWVQGQNAKSKRFTLVSGGALDEAFSVAKTRASVANDPNVLTVGVGRVIDRGMLDVNGNATVLSTSQFAPRVAGALAARGESLSLTYARFANVDIANASSAQNVADAYDAGVIVLEKDSNVNPVRLSRARTTFIAGAAGGPAADPARPYSIYSEPKFVRTMQSFEMELVEWAEGSIIGQLPVNDKTRSTIVGEGKARLQKREEADIIQSGWTVGISPNPVPTDAQAFVAVTYSIGFGRSIEQVFNTILVS